MKPTAFIARPWQLLGLLMVFFHLAGCALSGPKLEKPSVKVAALKLLPATGFAQPIQVDLLIANPNGRDLSLRGISYSIGIENYDLLTGVSNQLPALKAYQETSVSVVVTANILQLVHLLEHLGKSGLGDKVSYNFKAKLDFSAWLPAMNIEEKGEIPLRGRP